MFRELKESEMQNMELQQEAERKKSYEDLLQGNRDWVAAELKDDPNYFSKLAAGQNPDVL